VQLVNFILGAEKEVFDRDIDETWQVQLSDESLVELYEGGAEDKVTFEKRLDYVR